MVQVVCLLIQKQSGESFEEVMGRITYFRFHFLGARARGRLWLRGPHQPVLRGNH